MKRRHLLAGAAATALTGGFGANVFAADYNTVEYDRAAYEKAIADGEAFLLDFFADW